MNQEKRRKRAKAKAKKNRLWREKTYVDKDGNVRRKHRVVDDSKPIVPVI